MIILENQATAFPIDSSINRAAATISSTEKKQLADTHAQLQKLNRLSAKFQKPLMNQQHPLDAEIQAAEVALAADPSEKLALELHGLILRKSQSELTAPTIAASIGRKVRETIDSLQPVAISLLDRAEVDFLAEAERHREASKTTTSFSTPQADFEARVESSVATFSRKRKWIQTENAAAHFLYAELGLVV